MLSVRNSPLSLLILLGAIAPTYAGQDEPLPCGVVELDPKDIPLVGLGHVNAYAGEPLVIGLPEEQIVTIRVAGPYFDNPSQGVQCGRDYEAEIIGALAVITFHRSCPFYVEVETANGVTLAGHVLVDGVLLDGDTMIEGLGNTHPGMYGAQKIYGCPLGAFTLGLPGVPAMDVNHPIPAIEPRTPVASFDEMFEALEAYSDYLKEIAGSDVNFDLTIVGHGSPGNQDFGSDTLWAGNAPYVGGRLRQYCEGRQVTLLGCNVGLFEDGEKLVCELADNSCTLVEAPRSVIALHKWDGQVYGDCVPSFTKDARPDHFAPGSAAPSSSQAVRPLSIIGPSSEERVKHPLLLPLDLTLSRLSPVERLLFHWQKPDARWDLDRSGIVDQSDLDLLVRCVPQLCR
jgi:hypothetical protein